MHKHARVIKGSLVLRSPTPQRIPPHAHTAVNFCNCPTYIHGILYILRNITFLPHTCVLLYSGEGLLEGVSCGGALGGVGRQAVGVHSLHSRVPVRLMRDTGESVDNGRDDAGHSGGGYVGWWRTEACWEKKRKKALPLL